MSFTRMDESTQEDWIVIATETVAVQEGVPERILGLLRELKAITGGFAVDQLHHALQTATMAERSGAGTEVVVAALVHDVGKAISIPNHAAIGAEIARLYVTEDLYHVLRTHQDFQGRHYYQHFGRSQTLRDQYVDEPWYGLACRFTDEWDQAAFDPDYPVEPLEHFEPLVREVFSAPKGF